MVWIKQKLFSLPLSIFSNWSRKNTSKKALMELKLILRTINQSWYVLYDCLVFKLLEDWDIPILKFISTDKNNLFLLFQDLFIAKHVGLLALLDEECNFPQVFFNFWMNDKIVSYNFMIHSSFSNSVFESGTCLQFWASLSIVETTIVFIAIIVVKYYVSSCLFIAMNLWLE